MLPYEGYQLREAMSKNLEPFQGASESPHKPGEQCKQCNCIKASAEGIPLQ